MLGLFLLFALNSFFSTLFSKKKTALLLTNQNGEIFSCILLGVKQVDKGEIFKSNTKLTFRALQIASF